MSSTYPHTPESSDQDNQTQTVSNPNPPNDKSLENQPPDDGEAIKGDDDDEETECGFCLFMKGGGCKDQFIAWEKCVDDAEMNNKDIVDKCFEVTGLLKKCMDAHSDYYEPILHAEKAMEEEAE